MITVPTNGCTVGISQMLTGTNRKTISVTTDIEATIFEVESKLTEADFTSRPQDVVTRYRDFDSVFDLPMLPQTETDYRGYQLVRNILCAAAHGYVFTLVSDARRPDLIRDWRSVGRAVRVKRLGVPFSETGVPSPAMTRSHGHGSESGV